MTTFLGFRHRGNALPLLVVLVCGLTARSVVAQTIDPTADKVIAAYASTAVSSVHLEGNVHAVAGGSDETGTFTYDLAQDGSSTLVISAGTLSRSETRSAFASDATCTWTGPDGVQHAVAQHNCLLALDPMLPAFSLQAHATSLRETTDGQTLAYSRVFSGATGHTLDLLTEVSTVWLTIDATTSLPSALAFSAHSESDANTNIPVVIQYSDYRPLSGANLPFHIQKFVNYGLAFDFQVTSAAVQ